jgi:elongation of very long chain fatty acids protein 4
LIFFSANGSALIFSDNKVSFLHVYHHTSTAIAWWIGLRLHPGGDIYFGALLNSIIHVMMYSYYTFALLKIRCPWKKYLTIAQLTQFVTVLCYSAYSVTHMPDDSNWRHYLGHFIQSFEMISLFAFFLFFFRRAYSRNPTKNVASNSDAASLGSEAESLSSQSSNTASDQQ